MARERSPSDIRPRNISRLRFTRARARSGPKVVMIDTASRPTGIWNSTNAAW